MKNVVKFQENMALLSLIFDRELPEAANDVYWQALEPYKDDDCIKAFKFAMDNNVFFPRPATLVRFLKSLTPDPTVEQKAIVQVGKILAHQKTNPSHIQPQYDDAISKHLMNSRWRYQGWASTVTNEELEYFKHDFVKAYVAFASGPEANNIKPLEIATTSTKAAGQAVFVLEQKNSEGGSSCPAFSDKTTEMLMQVKWPYMQWVQQHKSAKDAAFKEAFVKQYCLLESHNSGKTEQITASKKVLRLVKNIGVEI